MSSSLSVHRYGVSVFFFFQAEDGIRDHCVTGVQTCALPISRRNEGRAGTERREERLEHARAPLEHVDEVDARSEERRVGKGVDLGGRRSVKKKKEKKESTECGTQEKHAA